MNYREKTHKILALKEARKFLTNYNVINFAEVDLCDIFHQFFRSTCSYSAIPNLRIEKYDKSKVKELIIKELSKLKIDNELICKISSKEWDPWVWFSLSLKDLEVFLDRYLDKQKEIMILSLEQNSGIITHDLEHSYDIYIYGGEQESEADFKPPSSDFNQLT